jgi:alpha-L-fucosidase
VPVRDPLLRRLRAHIVPAWWRDAKLGIFVHWTPASVAGFAPVDADIGALVRSGRRDALAWTPYTEWYENSLRFPQSPVAAHHREVYGDRPYIEFAREWEAGLAQWDPDAWARTFAATGAR